jgi:hypothetical protein
VLLDQFAPRPHFKASYSVVVDVSADEAYRAIWTTDFGSSSVITALMLLRNLPSLLLRRKAALHVGRSLTLQAVIDSGFGRLAETPGREVVLGLVGRFWTPTGNLEPFRPGYFTGELPPGLAKAVWNFAVQDRRAAGEPVRVVTETRVVCADPASKHKFGLYWALVRPFSGLIRLVMLRAIQRTCAGDRGLRMPDPEMSQSASEQTSQPLQMTGPAWRLCEMVRPSAGPASEGSRSA